MEHTPKTWDRIRIGAVALLLAAFALSAFGFVATAGADEEDVAGEYGDGPGEYIDVTSDTIPFGALSGLATGDDDDDDDGLYSVPDNAMSPSRIFTLELGNPTDVVSELILTQDGGPLSYDLEGIAVRPQGGWWVVSEGAGNAPTVRTENLLVRVLPDGSVAQEVRLPASVAQNQRQFGFEGVASNEDGSQIYVAFQAEWLDDRTGLIKIGRYTPDTGQWAFFHYRRDFGPGRIGLSEITQVDDDTYIVLERDNRAGAAATVKRVYAFSIAGVTPAPPGGTPPVLTKTLVRDLLLEDGYPYEKAEGVAIVDDHVLVLNDNDGVGLGPTQILRSAIDISFGGTD